MNSLKITGKFILLLFHFGSIQNLQKLYVVIFVTLIISNGNLAQGQTFANTTTAACDSWNSNNLYVGFTRTITVTGLPIPLGTGAGQVVLKQVNLQLGTSTCKGNLSTYYARLVSPTGTIIQLFGPFNGTTTSSWMDIQLRDDASLERVKDYSVTTQQGYFPWSIGYYRTDVIDAFSAVNGENPNGVWTLQIAENTSTEVSFEKVELVFDTYVAVNDVTGSSANNDCSGVTCLDGSKPIRATNNGYSGADPNYPGNTVSGCSWNGANNNSSWFEFVANGTTAYITVSGMAAVATGSADMQPLVVSRSGGDCSSGTFSVPTGGCPDDQTVNNTAYINTNGGGLISANVYSNGITPNVEFNLSGLTSGNKYYLYIDGNSAASSDFYIEAENGTSGCGVLPIELLNFDVKKEGDTYVANWVTINEINNDYFTLERSSDVNTNWVEVATILGAGNSSAELKYQYMDKPHDKYNTASIYYYRLKQTDYDGNYTYSKIISIKNSRDSYGDNRIKIIRRSDQSFTLTFSEKWNETSISIYDIMGREIKAMQYMNSHENNSINVKLKENISGVKLIKVVDKFNTQIIKLY